MRPAVVLSSTMSKTHEAERAALADILRMRVKRVSVESFTARNAWAIEFDDDSVTFDTLQKLADIYGTTIINVGSESRETGYCETCCGSYSVTIVTVVAPAIVLVETCSK